MTGIIFDKKAEAESLIDSVNEKVSFILRGKTEMYTSLITHKDGGKFFVPILIDDMKMIDNLYPSIINDIGREFMSMIVFEPLDGWIEQPNF